MVAGTVKNFTDTELCLYTNNFTGYADIKFRFYLRLTVSENAHITAGNVQEGQTHGRN